jgi:hypothetical protein
MDTWKGILHFTQQKDTNNWPWPKDDDHLSLFVNNDAGMTNIRLAKLLSTPLEHKFRKKILE